MHIKHLPIKVDVFTIIKGDKEEGKMIYLDYAATTPTAPKVLETFCELSTKYIANPNSSHDLGTQAKLHLDEVTQGIAELIGVTQKEIIYTSGASEANNLAIKGIASYYKRYGKHIITTYLEHASVIGPITALKNSGYEVDFVNILENGLVDLEHLKELLREDTILVSIHYVDSEIGIRQDMDKISALVNEYPHCFLHVDATQAIGKIKFSVQHIDLMSLSSHKFYGLKGCGMLIKKDHVMLEPLIHGGISTTPFRSGTPAVALAGSTKEALSQAIKEQDKRFQHVSELNHILRKKLKTFKNLKINSPATSIPFILNLSILGISSVHFQKALEEYECYISTKSACCSPQAPSQAVYALTQDKKRAISSLRVSLSHLTTPEECYAFLEYFELCYKKIVK